MFYNEPLWWIVILSNIDWKKASWQSRRSENFFGFQRQKPLEEWTDWAKAHKTDFVFQQYLDALTDSAKAHKTDFVFQEAEKFKIFDLGAKKSEDSRS